LSGKHLALVGGVSNEVFGKKEMIDKSSFTNVCLKPSRTTGSGRRGEGRKES